MIATFLPSKVTWFKRILFGLFSHLFQNHIILNRLSSPYTGHIPYSGQFLSTNFHSNLNVFTFLMIIKLIPVDAKHSKNVSVTLYLEKFQIIILEEFCWKYMFSPLKMFFLWSIYIEPCIRRKFTMHLTVVRQCNDSVYTDKNADRKDKKTKRYGVIG